MSQIVWAKEEYLYRGAGTQRKQSGGLGFGLAGAFGGRTCGEFTPMPPVDVPKLKAAGPDPAQWIKPSDKPLTFRTVGQTKDVTLVPINSLFDKRYVV